ncbi:Eukaryotic aspartyl protease [Aphelenchoides bicaudatus]|nr:Eukaryotic aspartyl protease [Aphelenchoides bicaudatus]
MLKNNLTSLCLMLFLASLYASQFEVVEIDDYLDNYYAINLTIGNPPQVFTVKLDTAFSQLLLEQVGCAVDPPFDPTSTYGPTTKRQFDPAKSSTITETEDYCSDGYDALDVIKIGNLTVTSGSFCLLHDISYNEHYEKYDGILGLNFMDDNEDQAIMPEIMKQLDNKIFTIWLNDRKENRQPESFGGLLTFGGLDLQNCDPNFDFVPVTKNMDWPYDWRVDFSRFSIGKYTSVDNRQARIYSGEKYLFIAAADYHMVITTIGAQFNYLLKEYVVECDRRDSLPKMTFQIGGKDFNISAYEYLYKTDLDGLCIVGVYSSNELEAPDIWSLGEAFLRAHCISFDYENTSQIGFSKSLKNRRN